MSKLGMVRSFRNNSHDASCQENSIGVPSRLEADGLADFRAELPASNSGFGSVAGWVYPTLSANDSMTHTT